MIRVVGTANLSQRANVTLNPAAAHVAAVCEAFRIGIYGVTLLPYLAQRQPAEAYVHDGDGAGVRAKRDRINAL